MLSAGDQVNYADREYEYAGYLSASALASLPRIYHDRQPRQRIISVFLPLQHIQPFDLDDTTYALGHKRRHRHYYTYGDALFIVIDTNNYNCATTEM